MSKEKRRRLQNTSYEQFQIYLEYMEKDYVLRSGTINPSLEDNYIDKQWNEIMHKLNAVGNGPCLTAEEWKKRFADWKYATKAKYRKLRELANKTGGGPQSQIKLTPLEERGLSVWGRVTVCGAEQVTTYDGIAATNEPIEIEFAPEVILDNSVIETLVVPLILYTQIAHAWVAIRKAPNAGEHHAPLPFSVSLPATVR